MISQAPHMRQVKASAGSGKTHDITGCFLDYLAGLNLASHKPSCALRYDRSQGTWADILAITFTNAAATEMKERVITRLKKIALGKETEHGITPEQAKSWINVILRQYGSLNIRTIDSLLHRIVRTAALDLNLPPDFETSFATDETLEPILDALLERAWHGDTQILNMLESICLSLLYREHSSGFAIGKRILSATRPLLEEALKGNLIATSSKADMEMAIKNVERELLRLATRMLELVEEEELQLKKNIFEILVACTHADKKKADSAYLKKSHINEILLKKSHGLASKEAQNIYIKLTHAARALVCDAHVLQKAIEWQPFVEFTKLIAKEVQIFQQKEQKVPAASMPLMAKKILNFEYGGVPQALCRLGNAIHHILLDEFQDTSHEQWNALRPLVEEALSSGGSLTWVGDIKQAIYGWRGGDSELFDALLAEQNLTNIVGENIEQKNLPINWRSREDIVKTNNKIFSPFKDETTAKNILAAMLSKDVPIHLLNMGSKKLCKAFADVEQNVKPENFAGGFVTIEEVLAEKSEELDEVVKEKLQERMQELVKRRAFGDITILTRSNPGAAKVADWLMELDIPVITENSLRLNSHPLIQESLALLSFLNTSHDNLSFWTLLSGAMLAPYLGKPNYSPNTEELHDFILQEHGGSLSAHFQSKWPEFWEDVFAPFYNTAQFITPYDTLQEWYRVLQIFQHFPEATTFLRRFLEIIHNAAERGQATLSTFLEYWLKYGTDEKAPMPSKINAVQIMTIHKSKGLQFKVVILPWSSFNQKEQYPPPINYQVQKLNVIAPRCTQMGDVYYEAQIESALESINTFYVACTRAEEELHIFHTYTPHMLKVRRNLACGLNELLPLAGFELPVKIGIPADTTEDRDPIELPKPILEKPEHISAEKSLYISRPMQWLPRLKIFRNPLQELILTPRLRGLLTHHCLEQFQSTGRAQADASKAVELGLRTFALPISHSEELKNELIKALTWYADLPEVWTNKSLAEQSLMDEDGNIFRADLLLPPHANYGWRAIDFKTGQADSEHIKQMRNYLRLLNALATNPEKNRALPFSEGVLIYLDLQKCRMVNADKISDLLPAPTWQRALA